MKAYLWTTGVIFALIVVAHLWRIFVESPGIGRDPSFLILTVLAASLSVWAGFLLRRVSPPRI